MKAGIAIVKREGKRPTEAYSRKKLQASVYAACLSVRSLEGHAKQTATQVADAVEARMQNKSEVTSADIRRQAAKALSKLHPDAAYLYQHHRVIL